MRTGFLTLLLVLLLLLSTLSSCGVIFGNDGEQTEDEEGVTDAETPAGVGNGAEQESDGVSESDTDASNESGSAGGSESGEGTQPPDGSETGTPGIDPPVSDLGLSYTLTGYGTSYAVTGVGTYKENTLAIPESYNGLPVTEIGEGAFKNCTFLTEITLPAAIVMIGDDAFAGCTALREIILPEGLTSIGSGAFRGCSALLALEIPDTVLLIGDHAFSGCVLITVIVLPGRMSSVAAGLFEDCSALELVTIPETVTKIGDDAFKGCRAIVKITLPDALKTIGSGAFESCVSLSEITVPGGVGMLAERTFKGCSALAAIALPSQMTEIGSSAFEGCAKLSDVKLPKSVQKIGSNAFKDCVLILVIVLPENLLEIGSGAFSGCTELGTVYVQSAKLPTGLDPAITATVKIEVDHSVHTWVQHPAKASTCEERGWNAYQECSVCGESTFEYLPKGEHQIVTDPAVAATCTAPGKTEGKRCSVCKTVLVAQRETPKGEHQYGAWVIDRDATCATQGEQHRVCGGCGYTDSVKLNVTDHAIVDGICSLCGYEKIQIINSEVFEYDQNGNRIKHDRVFLKVGKNTYYVVNNSVIYNFLEAGADGDSDIDALSNREEVNLGTNPFNADSDNDGANDGKEVLMGFDPLTANASFAVSRPPVIDNSDKPDTVTPTVEVELSGDQVNSLVVARDSFFNTDTIGYLGDAYRYDVEGDIDEATVGFEFDTTKLNANSLPTIYSYDVEKGRMTPLAMTVTGNKATTEVSEFSTFVLLDRYVFENQLSWVDVWGIDGGNYTDVEIVFVIDDSGSMTSNDRNYVRLSVARTLIDDLPENSRIGIVRFAGSTTKLTGSLTTDKAFAKGCLTTSYFKSSGSTYMYEAMRDSMSLYSTPTEGDSVLRVMVVLSDGQPSSSSYMNSAITSAQNKGVMVYTVGLGNSYSSYFNTYLKPVSEGTGGKFYLSSDALGLAEIFDDIGEKIDLTTDADNDGLLDYYEDNMVIFSGITYTADKADPDTDDDGLLDGEEIETVVIMSMDGKKMTIAGKVYSDPAKADTDGDGVNDKNDKTPLDGAVA